MRSPFLQLLQRFAFLLPGCLAAGELSFAPAAVRPGSDVAIPIELDPAGDGISAFQFDLLYDASVLHVNAETPARLADAHKKVYAAPVEQGRLRIVVAGANTRSLAGSAIVTVIVSVSPHAPPGLHQIRFMNVSASDAQGTSVGVIALDSAVSVAP